MIKLLCLFLMLYPTPILEHPVKPTKEVCEKLELSSQCKTIRIRQKYVGRQIPK